MNTIVCIYIQIFINTQTIFNLFSVQRLGKHSMGFTVGTYPGEKKKILPRSSSPVLKTHQGASSRVMKGNGSIA
jgi:hypothetical protein